MTDYTERVARSRLGSFLLLCKHIFAESSVGIDCIYISITRLGVDNVGFVTEDILVGGFNLRKIFNPLIRSRVLTVVYSFLSHEGVLVNLPYNVNGSRRNVARCFFSVRIRAGFVYHIKISVDNAQSLAHGHVFIFSRACARHEIYVSRLARDSKSFRSGERKVNIKNVKLAYVVIVIILTLP